MENEKIKEAVKETTTPEKKDLPVMVWSESKWGECRYPDKNGS
jgi:hypothetical protein